MIYGTITWINSVESKLAAASKFSINTCYGADNDEASWGVIWFLQVIKKQTSKKEVAKMVHPNTHFKPVGCVVGLAGSRLVDGSIAHEHIQWHARALQVGNKLADAVKGGKIKVHDAVVLFEHASWLCCLFGLEEIAAGHDHVPLAWLCQGLGCCKAEARWGAGDDYIAFSQCLLPFWGTAVHSWCSCGCRLGPHTDGDIYPLQVKRKW